MVAEQVGDLPDHQARVTQQRHRVIVSQLVDEGSIDALACHETRAWQSPAAGLASSK
jgi:hypothetical protein